MAKYHKSNPRNYQKYRATHVAKNQEAIRIKDGVSKTKYYKINANSARSDSLSRYYSKNREAKIKTPGYRCKKPRQEALAKKLLDIAVGNVAAPAKRYAPEVVRIQIEANLLSAQALKIKTVLYAKLKLQATAFGKKCKDILKKLGDQQLSSETLLQAIGGKRLHCSSCEPYFLAVTYNTFNESDKPLMLNDEGVATNVFNVDRRNVITDMHQNEQITLSKNETTESRQRKINKPGVFWECAMNCNIRENSLERLADILLTFASCKECTLTEFYSNIDECALRDLDPPANPFVQYRTEDPSFELMVQWRHPKTRGHSLACLENNRCISILRLLRELAPHFTAMRSLVRTVYKLKALAQEHRAISNAIEKADMNELRTTVHRLQTELVRKRTKTPTNIPENVPSLTETLIRPTLDEEELRKTYQKQFTHCFREMNEFHDTPCDCCEILYQSKNLTTLEKLASKREIDSNQAFNTLRTVWQIQRPHCPDFDYRADLNLCDCCSKSLLAEKIPARCFLNGLEVDPVPKEISDLNIFEKMLIQKAKAFQTVVRLGTQIKTFNHTGLSRAIKGKVLYLPLPLQSNTDMIPKELPKNHELHIIVNGLPTKSKLVWQSLVRLDKVRDSLVKLKEINPLYAQLDVEQFNNEYVCGPVDDENLRISTQPDALLEKMTKSQEHEMYDHFSIHPINGKNPSDILDTFKLKKVEGEPLSHFEKNLDYLCFPDLFPTGKFGRFAERPFGPLRDADFRISRIRNKNRRFSLNEQYLFHTFSESEIKAMSSAINYMLRMCNSKRMSVNSLIDKVDTRDFELETALSSFMRSMRGTQEYWYKRTSELNTMRQDFGSPTWFVTLSCAEYDWIPLLDHLKQYQNSSKSVSELCSNDPVAVSLHYHNRIHSILRNLILTKDNPVLGPVEHYFWRVEYQARGAPHVHMVLWIKNAPQIGVSTKEEILAFIAKYATCSLPDKIASPTLTEYVQKYQSHKCNPSCRREGKWGKKSSTKCRFKFPRAATTHAQLHDVQATVKQHVAAKSGRLYELPRKETEVFINDYNPALLLALQANMHIQFIADKDSALATYVTGYISKKEKSNDDELWNELAGKDLHTRLWSFGLKRLTHRECGAYEVVDRILGHHLYGKSESMVYVNTFKKDSRKRLLKPFKDLKRLKEVDPENDDIFAVQLVDDVYPNRPDELDNESLYEFARFYYRQPLKGEAPENALVLKNQKGILKRRVKPYLIQFPNHNPLKSDEERENYCRSLLMLFLPWRDENTILEFHSTYTEAFESELPRLERMKAYHENLMVLKGAQEKLKKLQKDQSDKEAARVLNNNNVNEVLHDVENAFQCQEIEEEEIFMADIDTFIAGNNAESNSLNQQIALLYPDQDKIFRKVQSHFSSEGEKKKPLCMFVSGFGGTGKSFLIKTIRNLVITNFSDLRSVAMVAPTGLAAYNIGGLTVHKLLTMPIEHGKTAKYQKLSADSLLAMRRTLGKLKLLVIDEVSMVSSLLLAYIHLRLAEIMANEDLFGGVSVLAFGDLLQLQPVKGDPPFCNLSHMEASLKIGSVGGENIWRNYFEYDELTINKRQKDDKTYGDLLSRVRVGEVTESDEKLLRSRIIDNPDNPENIAEYYSKLVREGQSPVCLFPTNDLCSKMNSIMLQKCDFPIIELQCVDEIADRVQWNKTIRDQLKKLEQKTSDTAGLEAKLRLCVGARVMLRRNLSLENGLVNGAMGILKELRKDDSGKVKVLEILFDGQSQSYSIERVSAKFELLKNVYVKRRQFPIVLAYGITIHKSQGMSLKCAIMDLGPKCFQSGMAYVALSRVTTLDGVHLLRFEPNKVYAASKAIGEYNRLRAAYRNDLPKLKVIPRKPSSTKMTKNVRAIDSVLPENTGVAIFGNWNTNPSNVIPIKGLANEGNTCYANASLQTLLAIPEFGQYIQNKVIGTGQTTLALQNLLLQLESLKCENIQSTQSVRLCLHQRFWGNEVQQDSAEFMNDLLHLLEMESVGFENCLSHEIEEQRRCAKCALTHPERQTSSILVQNTSYVVNMPSDPVSKVHGIEFSELFDKWQKFESRCVHCGHQEMESRSVLRSVNKYLLLNLARFQFVPSAVRNQPGVAVKLRYPIINFVNQKVKIGVMTFKTKAAVIHHGSSTNSGHYTCLVHRKHGKDNWVLCNDLKVESRKTFVKSLTDVYLLLLEKISH